MRRKRPALVLTFASTSQAIAAGCGLAWKAEPEDKQVLLDALAQVGYAFEACAVVEMFA